MAIKYLGNGQYTCGSGDTKPSTAMTGGQIVETDTRKKFYYDGTDWILQEIPNMKRFKVFNVGSKTFVVDIHGKVQNSATETQDAINPILAGQANNSIYHWEFDTTAFTMYDPILIPSHGQGVLKKNIFRNELFSPVRAASSGAAGGVTTLIPDATFPTNRYLFETDNDVGSETTSAVEINGFQAINVSNIGNINVGFCKLESDNPNGNINWVVKNCYFNYLWRGIHLIGYIWWGAFEDILITISSDLFAGDAPLILEDGGHSQFNNPTPKANYFRNFQTHSGDGTYVDFLRIQSGGYNMFDNFVVDGKFYSNCIFTLNNTDTLAIHNNKFRDIMTMDIEKIPASSPHGTLYLAGTSVFDNTFEKCRFSVLDGKTVKLEGAGVMNNDIEVDSYWGANAPIISHVTNGESNTIRVFAGAKTDAGNSPITLSGTAGVNRCRVIDARRGAELGGTASVADGGTITHNLMAAPVWYWVMPTVAGEMASVTSVSSTTLTVALKTHGGLAGTTQTVSWRAGVYL